jgi:hypothetical protein
MGYFRILTLILCLIVSGTAAMYLIEGDCRNNREVAICFSVLIPCVFSVICILYSFFDK